MLTNSVKKLAVVCCGLIKHRHLVQKEIVLSCYYSAFVSRLRYGIVVWGDSLSMHEFSSCKNYHHHLLFKEIPCKKLDRSYKVACYAK